MAVYLVPATGHVKMKPMSLSPPPPIQVRGLDHVTIVVKDLDASARFYVGLLGMDEVPRPAFGFPGRWFQAGRTQIHLNLESVEAGKAGVPAGNGLRPSRGFHYAFEVQDCDAAIARLEHLKIPVAAGPAVRPDGARQVYVRDPDGHLIELFSLRSTDTCSR
jgi:catechol 2,3-dioxygenase-like lactoylglutathione lyase family enzyme